MRSFRSQPFPRTREIFHGGDNSVGYVVTDRESWNVPSVGSTLWHVPRTPTHDPPGGVGHGCQIANSRKKETTGTSVKGRTIFTAMLCKKPLRPAWWKYVPGNTVP